MKTITIIMAAIVLWTAGAGSCAWAGGVGAAVEVRIVADDGRTLPIYPALRRPGVFKAYAEAVKGDHYRIEVQNRLDRRVGLVIAVDGRNIISGTKSWLKHNERMYILEPYGSGEFAGWRTAADRINRFYFTDVPDSYAAAFGDESAMGVIAVACFPEVRRCETPTILPQITPPAALSYEGKAAGSADGLDTGAAAPSASGRLMAEKSAPSEQALESAGTGYGREEYSPSHIVAFEPEKRALETVFLKYEWRATLCRLGVMACTHPPQPHNRLWGDDGYAPPPPLGFRR